MNTFAMICGALAFLVGLVVAFLGFSATLAVFPLLLTPTVGSALPEIHLSLISGTLGAILAVIGVAVMYIGQKGEDETKRRAARPSETAEKRLSPSLDRQA